MSEQRYPVHVAENFLRWNLPANSKDIEARAQAVGIASTTLWRARRRLGVVVKNAVWFRRLQFLVLRQWRSRYEQASARPASV